MWVRWQLGGAGAGRQTGGTTIQQQMSTEVLTCLCEFLPNLIARQNMYKSRYEQFSA